jgi:hypothetical protein
VRHLPQIISAPPGKTVSVRAPPKSEGPQSWHPDPFGRTGRASWKGGILSRFAQASTCAWLQPYGGTFPWFER